MEDYRDDADRINQEQIEAAKKAGKEYQGRESEPAPKVTTEDHAPKSGAEEEKPAPKASVKED